MSSNSRFILWGSAGHAKVLQEIIAMQYGQVTALFDNSAVSSALDGVPLYRGEVGFHLWREGQEDLQRINGLVAIGGNRGRDRLLIQKLFQKNGIQIPMLIHPTAVVSVSARIGAGSQVLALANIASHTIMGEGCIVNHRASVDHECVIGDGAHIAPGATLCGNVNLGENAFVGAGAVVLPRLTIGADAFVGAGSVVTQNVPDGVTVVGNPARPIKNSN